tara:strand:- start:546 stop:2087 length:1542 start_codon:yes stop_codon:yes gene_type:complete
VISKRSTSKKIANALLSNNAAVLIRVLVAFFLSPFLVHTLGDTKYGIWTIMAALSGYMCLLDLGIVSAITKYTSEHYQTNETKQLNIIVNTCLFIFLCVTTIVLVASPLIAQGVITFLDFNPEIQHTVYMLTIIISFDISLFVISGVFRGTFAGLLRHDILSIIGIVSALYKALMFYLFLSNGYGLITMGFIAVSSNLLAITIFYIILKRQFSFIKFDLRTVSKSSINKVFAFSKYTFLSMLANQIIFYSDAFVIGYFLSAAAVTYYTIPWSLMEYVKSFCLAISGTYIAIFAEHNALQDKEKLYNAYVSASKLMLAFSNLMCIGMIVFGGAFISIWMGPKYGETGQPIIIIFALIQLAMSPQLISLSLLQGLSKHKIYSQLSFAVSVINLILSIWLVQEYGLIGVAVGAAIPQLLFYILFVPKYTTNVIGIPLWTYLKDTYFKLAIPSIGLFISLKLFLDNSYPNGFLILISEAIACAALYLITIYFFSLSKTEKDKVDTMMMKLKTKLALF